MTLIISYLAIFFILIQWLFWLLFQRLFFFNSKVESASNTGISVIVSIKNGESFIKEFIESLLNQSYLFYEVVLIDDFSSDNTLEYLQHYAGSQVKIVSASMDLPGKKLALTDGIKAAQYDWLLFTDVDCIPSSRNWIQSMVDHSTQSDVVLGYGPLRNSKRLISLFSSYETIVTAVQYLNYALYKLPYMGVGRNMLVDKNAWHRAGGYSTHTDIASGDDDLLIQDIASVNRDRISINISKDSYMSSPSKNSLKTYISQKRRHVSTSIRYTWKHKILLTLYGLSHIAVYGLLLVLLFYNSYQAFYLFLGYILIKWLLSILPFLKLNEVSKLLWFPLLDALLAAYYAIMIILMPIRKTESWS